MIQNGQPNGGYLLNHDGRFIPIRIDLGDRSKLTINVHPNMRVEVLAPQNQPLDQILARIERRASWIVKQWQYFEEFQPTLPKRQFVSGETHVYLGRQYRLKVSKGSPSAVKLVGRYFQVQHSDRDDTDTIGSLLEAWYLNHAKCLFAHRLRKCHQECRTLGLPNDPTVTVRKMAHRWGSCTQAGNISLNIDLVKTPVYCIDYVIIHEMCHLKIHNHSPSFYRLLTRCMPDWEVRKKRLEAFVL